MQIQANFCNCFLENSEVKIKGLIQKILKIKRIL